MDLVYKIFLILHLLSWAMILGGVIVSLKEPRLVKGTTHAALTALVTGLLLVGIKEMGDGSLNHMKIGIKTLVTIAVVSGKITVDGTTLKAGDFAIVPATLASSARLVKPADAESQWLEIRVPV